MKEKLLNYRGELIAALSGILFITIASTWESPIYKGAYGYDAAFFSMMGRAILNGKVPYKDYFDVKGPVFFFIEALGQLIHTDRLGVYIIECIATMIAMIILVKICKLYRFSAKKTVAVFAAVYFVYITTLWGGNTAEEFFLPLNLSCLYFSLKFIKKCEKDVSIAFFFGLTVALGVLSKITIIAPAGACIVCVLGYLIAKKRYKELGAAALYFIAGAIVASLPVFLYFYFRGAINDFITAAFITAFKRSTDYYEPFSLKWEAYLLVCYGGFISAICRFKYKGIEKWFLGLMSLVTFLALHLGTPFDYYFTTTLPVYILLAIVINEDAKRLYYFKGKAFRYILNNMILSLILLMVGVMYYGGKTTHKLDECYRLFTEQYEADRYERYKEVFALIPEFEQDDVFCIESGMIVYEVNQKLPASKYPVNFPYFTNLYPPSLKEVKYKLNTYPPKWIVSERIENLEIEDLRYFVMDNYLKILDNGEDELWIRKN